MTQMAQTDRQRAELCMSKMKVNRQEPLEGAGKRKEIQNS